MLLYVCTGIILYTGDNSLLWLKFQFETSHYPGFEELRPFLRDNYDFDMEFVKALDGFEWLSWLVQEVSSSQEGHKSKFVLKVGEVEKDRDMVPELEWRQEMMQHFRDHGITCQLVVPTACRKLHCFYRADDGGKFVWWEQLAITLTHSGGNEGAYIL